jgi:AraC family transcriptional regulator
MGGDTMNPVEKALWFIESHFATDIALEDIAKAAGVSRFYMTRSFAAATNCSIMRYVRGRRLSEAAKALLNGAPDILTVSLDASYGSHEAFTRAFRSEFGLTPEALRAQGNGTGLKLVEPIRLDHGLEIRMVPPRLLKAERLLVAGLGARYTCETSGAIPSQWQRFLPHKDQIPGQIGSVAYGVRCNDDDAGNFDYVCGVAVKDFSRIPADWTCLRIPEQSYAVFHSSDHISTIRSAWHTIWSHWLPESGYEAIDAPALERYDERFDSITGHGGFELWVAIEPKRREGKP